MIQEYVLFWKKTFDFKSKSSRREYWLVVLANFLIYLVLIFLSKFSIVDHKTKKRIFITSDKKKVEIGSFLNEEEIEELITLLKKKVQDLNFS